MAIDDPQGIRWDCRPCLPLTERLTAADGVGQGSVIPSHDPGRISRLRPVWRKLPSLRGKSPRVRGFADFYQRFFCETASQNTPDTGITSIGGAKLGNA